MNEDLKQQLTNLLNYAHVRGDTYSILAAKEFEN
jgi:hypothetical protein